MENGIIYVKMKTLSTGEVYLGCMDLKFVKKEFDFNSFTVHESLNEITDTSEINKIKGLECYKDQINKLIKNKEDVVIFDE